MGESTHLWGLRPLPADRHQDVVCSGSWGGRGGAAGHCCGPTPHILACRALQVIKTSPNHWSLTAWKWKQTDMHRKETWSVREGLKKETLTGRWQSSGVQRFSSAWNSPALASILKTSGYFEKYKWLVQSVSSLNTHAVGFPVENTGSHAKRTAAKNWHHFLPFMDYTNSSLFPHIHWAVSLTSFSSATLLDCLCLLF